MKLKIKLWIMLLIFIISIAIGYITYDGSITGLQIIWIVVALCEWCYLDWYFNRHD
jgi:hypothetical protein